MLKELQNSSADPNIEQAYNNEVKKNLELDEKILELETYKKAYIEENGDLKLELLTKETDLNCLKSD